ncbi:DUF5009 domain-containing protein [Sphingomonas sp. 2R-10]|uniref:acyltransferase family protein n=1 Tax=Sphingomonas sp. 2R-10 TaxID=3045148 RepID=UPI000F767862|nr:DUF5009 domain-containing protein [Sphingomonas sp. 2R-10]MDJ0278287.1 DUF5009 domain-containing protein [Sphingomonas sp. 2R-10]
MTTTTGTPAGRLASLDVLRGLTVMGMILVNSAAGIFYGHKVPVFGTLLHASWDGLTLADTVFPAFLMMVGVAIPMAQRRGGNGRPVAAAGPIVARALRLFVLGFLLSNLYWFADFDVGAWRLWGVLQRIGLVYGACALLYLHTGQRARIGIVVAVLVLYWPLLLMPAIDGLPNDLWARGHTFVASVDRWLLGAGNHNYVTGAEGYDPEGFLSTLPAIAHGLIGVCIGDYLRRERGRTAGRMLALAGVAMVAAGLAWNPFLPIIKDMWSSSFVLVTCGLTTVALAVLHLAIDGRATPPSWPWTIATAFGINAIAAYVLHMVTGNMVGWDLFFATYAATATVVSPAVAALVPILLYMALLWACVAWLARRGWIVKI